MASETFEPTEDAAYVHRQLQLLADISDQAVAYLDTRRRFRLTNTEFDRRFGEPPKNRHAGDFFEGVCSPAVDEYLKRAVDSGESLKAQLDCSSPEGGGTDRLRLKAVPHLNEGTVVGVFVSFHETETRHSSETTDDHGPLDPADALRDHRERMARLGEMAAGLTHEIRQPLAAIINYAGVLKRRLRNDPAAEAITGLADHIVSQARRADNIVASARSMAGKGKTPRIEFDIMRVVEDCMGLVERRARKLDVDIRIGSQAKLPTLQGNPHQVEQILVNLLNNALDAMNDADKRVLSIDVDTVASTDTVRVRVSDTGPGIDADRAQRIFNSMETTKHDGMGMGLSISRALAESHDGKLWLDTQAAEGACFVLDLPLALAEIPDTQTVSA
ncbi:ATP-binding protein [Salinisphaera sp. Q1T1-3]|uniref:ATP-binding protein n=1 Tax=Salinisphaera sp. Q1T1-3 TaxID=2321229 RepID=UPI000E72381B|nr:ATP-binding protein [Salinisphaera sp. Q1T1-3]RJS91277.1 GHKL domain-containing protein [Salinisphaera sp. Q1T1-3]